MVGNGVEIFTKSERRVHHEAKSRGPFVINNELTITALSPIVGIILTNGLRRFHCKNKPFELQYHFYYKNNHKWHGYYKPLLLCALFRVSIISLNQPNASGANHTQFHVQ